MDCSVVWLCRVVVELLVMSVECASATETLAPALNYARLPASRAQLWLGRLAMLVFASIVALEILHSNRPFWMF